MKPNQSLSNGGMPAGPLGGQARINPAILDHLRQQPVPPGWQTTMRLEERATWIGQIATALRLTQRRDQPINNNLNTTIFRNAVGFEMKSFHQSLSLDSYLKTMRSKLQEIRDSRQRMANDQTYQAMPQPPIGDQTPSLNSGQNPMSHGATPSGFQHSQPGVMHPDLGAMQMHGQIFNGQPMPSTISQPQPQSQLQLQLQPVAQQSLTSGAPQMSSEQMQINRIATVLHHKAKETGAINQVYETVKRFPLERLQQLEKAGMTPVDFHFRQQAMQVYRQQKERDRAQLAMAQHPVQQAGQPAPNDIQRNNQQNFMAGAQSHRMVGSDNSAFDFSQFVGIQAEAQRSLEAGDLVVPASNHQVLNPQFAGFGGRPLLNSGQRMPSSAQIRQPPPQMPPPQARREIPRRSPQPSMVQVTSQGQGSAQGQAGGMKGATLQGQIGGLHAPQQDQNFSPAMPMLNQPMRTPKNQSSKVMPHITSPRQAQLSANVRPVPQLFQPQQPRPNSGQRQPANINPINLSNFQLPPNFPSQLKDSFAGAQPDQIRALMESWQNQATMRQDHQTNRPTAMVCGESAQQHEYTIQPNQQASTTQLATPQVDFPLIQQPPLEKPNFDPLQGALPQQPNTIQPYQSNPPYSMLSNPRMEQMRIIDAMDLPREFVKREYPNVDFPEQLRSWGDLRKWMEHNPTTIPPSNRRPLFALQQAQFQSIRQRMQDTDVQQRNRDIEIRPTLQLATGNPSGVSPHLQALMQEGILHIVGGIPQLRGVTAQDVHIFREKVGLMAANVSDQDLMKRLMSDKFRKVQQRDDQLAKQVLMAHQLQRQQNNPNRMSDRDGVAIGQNGRPPFNQAVSMLSQPANSQPHLLPAQQPAQEPGPGTTPMVQWNADGFQATSNGNPAQMPSKTQVPQQMPLLAGSHGPPMTKDQWASLTPQQKAQVEAKFRQGVAHHGPPKPLDQPMESLPQTDNNVRALSAPNGTTMDEKTSREKDYRFQLLVQNVSASTLRGPSLPLSQEARMQMTARLQTCQQLVKKIKAAVRPFYHRFGREDAVVDMMRCINLVEQQRNDNGIQEFTIQPKELDRIIQKLAAFMKTMMAIQSRSVAANAANGPPPPISKVEVSPDPPKSSPSGLRQAPLQVQKTKKEPPSQKRNNKPVPAATSKNASILVGGTSPRGQGAPIYAQEVKHGFELKEPPPKRAKKDNRPGTPASTPAAQVVTPATSIASPPVTKVSKSTPSSMHESEALMEVELLFKCPIPGCDFETIGFASQADCDAHAKYVHGYVGDALAFCLGNMRKALGLDKPAVLAGTTSRASLVKPDLSKRSTPVPAALKDLPLQTKPPIEQLSKSQLAKPEGALAVKKDWITPASTPMSRPPTQNGVKIATPASTPRNGPPLTQSSIKTGTPSETHSKAPIAGARGVTSETTATAMGRTRSAVKSTASKGLQPGPPAVKVKEEDLWARSDISQAAIHAIFDNVDGFTNPFFNMPSDDDETPVTTPEPSKKSEESLAGPIRLEDWEPFPEVTGVFQALRVGAENGRDGDFDAEEGWRNMTFEQRYGRNAGLEEDEPMPDSRAFVGALDGMEDIQTEWLRTHPRTG